MKNKHFRAMSAADAVGWWNRFSSDVAARFKANISVRGLLSGALAVFLFIFGALRIILAFVMLWLRGLVLWVLQAVAAVSLVADAQAQSTAPVSVANAVWKAVNVPPMLTDGVNVSWLAPFKGPTLASV